MINYRECLKTKHILIIIEPLSWRNNKLLFPTRTLVERKVGHDMKTRL